MGKEFRAKLAAPEVMLPRADVPVIAMLALMESLVNAMELMEHDVTGDRDIRERRADYRKSLMEYIKKYNGTFIGKVENGMIEKCDRWICKSQDNMDKFFDDLTDEDLAEMERVKANWPQHKDN